MEDYHDADDDDEEDKAKDRSVLPRDLSQWTRTLTGSPPPPLSSKKKGPFVGSGRGGKAGKDYRPPTNDEIQSLKETEQLFKSNIFRLQVRNFAPLIPTP